ncbi:acyl-CoA/acyl-ACP dehydrogenase [Sabulilitoribacter arenilitoris]|uniref:Acyl-CoA/acyl-ACP dehydrogenase n=1 Tax=Wocania arenilitoris TaxID=2044858 RepID=A0AAE3ER13_9FLAO|nr:acyl-CoA dehydrogenase family protein [Wocania arenilitoris]MCF7569057.1 acyl-CoA/acyl-ACP dehydrogenase [Wocania arenilitoris]
MLKNKTDIEWISLTEKISQGFAEKAKQHDESGTFVHENYNVLKEHKFFSAMIPKELGGEGLSHTAMCECVKIVGESCGSTALALSMHQHLIAASVWKYFKDGSNETLLRNVSNHELILISTGARDWLGSNGELKKTNGGYLFSAKKHFASQSAIGDMVITSSIYEDTNNQKSVLHFGVPTNSVGVSLLDDWHVMGMRSTGSQTLVFDNVFIPNSAISLERPQGEFHGVWNVVIPVAMPLIMAAYVGIAKGAYSEAIKIGKKYQRNHKHLKYIVGKMYNSYILALTQWHSMVLTANNLRFDPDNQKTIDILSLKTNVSDACIDTVNQCMDAVGGQSFYKSHSIERMFRDVQAGNFHPLPKWDQYAFTGEIILNNN